jgi:hypothetical protein
MVLVEPDWNSRNKKGKGRFVSIDAPLLMFVRTKFWGECVQAETLSARMVGRQVLTGWGYYQRPAAAVAVMALVQDVQPCKSIRDSIELIPS